MTQRRLHPASAPAWLAIPFFALVAAAPLACSDLTRPGDEAPPVPAVPTSEGNAGNTANAGKPLPAHDDFPADESPPAQIRASHILVSYAGAQSSEQTRTKDQARARAEELLARLRRGEDFAKLAADYGEDATKQKGGDLGTFGHGMMVPPFESAAFALRKGETSGLVETPFGFHLIKRTE